MGFPAQLNAQDRQYPHDDTVRHFAAKETLIVLRVCVVLGIVATAVTMATFWFWAWVPAVVLLVLYGAMAMTTRYEERTRAVRFVSQDDAGPGSDVAAGDRDRGPVEPGVTVGEHAGEDDFTPAPLFRREFRLGVTILIGLGLAAIALIVIGLITGHLPWALVALAGGFIVFYGLLLMGPVWLGMFGDVEEEERTKTNHEPLPETRAQFD